MPFKIGNIEIGGEKSPYCIAEVGINHNGSMDLAMEMIKVAKESGADAVKFQTFKAIEFCDKNQKYTYKSQENIVVELMLDMFQRYEFSNKQWFDIKKKCDRESITFLSTPQNVSDLNLLLKVGMPAVKIGSDDLTNIPLISSYAKKNLPIILSSGMSDLAEVYNAINAAGGFDNNSVAVLLCTSQYPTPAEEVNLARLSTLKNAFTGITIGFSDHTQGSLASSLSVALGAEILEKHFTLDNNLPGPDHWFSENPEGLKNWVDSIRLSHTMKGCSLIRPTPLELKNKSEFQRVIVASSNINKREVLSLKNISMQRVKGGNGIKPIFLDYLIGTKAHKSHKKGEAIEL